MINSVKARTPILALILFVSAVGYTFAQNKVVVIPMAADEALWALVNSDGTIESQSGGVTVTHPSSGSNWVDFGKDVTGHAIIANLRYPSRKAIISLTICGGTGSETFNCTAMPSLNKNSVVWVGTYENDGTELVDNRFYVAVLP